MMLDSSVLILIAMTLFLRLVTVHVALYSSFRHRDVLLAFALFSPSDWNAEILNILTLLSCTVCFPSIFQACICDYAFSTSVCR